MKIDIGQAPGLDPATGRPTAGVREADRAVRRAGSAGGAGDRVDLSTPARALAALASEVGDVDGIDRGRVEEVRAALARGEFPPAPDRIAESLLRALVTGSG